MKLNTEQSNTTERVEPKLGLTQAVVSGIVDLGTQEKQFGAKRQVMITWELPHQTHVFDEDKGAQPLIRTKSYTMSLHEKAGLRKAIKGIQGKDISGEFDLYDLIGQNCMLSLIEVERDGKKYINIDSIAPLMDGMKAEEPKEVKKFSLDEFDMNDYMELYGWVQEKIASSPEYKALPPQGEEASARPADIDKSKPADASDIPF